MRKDKIHIAIIGFGQWGPNHARNFQQLEASQLSIICDLSESRRARAKAMFPGVPVTGKVEEVIADPTVDAVVIATPLVTHYPLVAQALAAGKHVLCEKPLAMTSAQAVELHEKAEAAGKILMVGHVFLFNPGILFLKDLIKRGDLGQIFYMDAVRTNLGPIREDVGALYDLASHDISIMNFIMEDTPLEVSATGARFTHQEFEDTGFMTMRYSGNRVCHIHTSWLNPRKVRQITVLGDRKMAVWDDMNTIEPIRIYDKGVTTDRPYATFGEFHMVLREGDILVPKVNMFEPLQRQDAHFLDCIREGGRPLCDAINGAEVVAVLEAAQASIREEGRMSAVAKVR